MNPAKDFLDALFAADTSIPIPLFRDGEACEVADYEAETLSGLYTSALTTAGVAFICAVAEEMPEDFKIRPTAILSKEGLSILIWAFDMLEKPENLETLSEALQAVTFDGVIPLPGSNGWKLTHFEPDTFTSLAAMVEAYASFEEVLEEEVQDQSAAPEVEEIAPTEPLGTYGDATIRRAYDENDYLAETVVTLGAATASQNWKPTPMPLGALIAKLATHREGQKDGPALVLADLVPGKRLKTSVKACTGIGLDIDTGTPSSVVNAALTKFGFTAIRYTTHSHSRSKTEFKLDKVRKFAPDEEIDTDLIHRFLKEVEQWDESIISSVEYTGTDHTEKGLVVVVTHSPIPKHRIVVPLAVPYEIAKEGKTQKEAMDRWAKVPAALAAKLGLPFDRSCVDPSRLFYFPRHAKGKPFEIDLWGGPLFDWRTLELDDPYEKLEAEFKSSGKSKTPEGKKLGRWSVTHAPGFQVVDVLESYCPDRIRGSATNGVTIECPFDEDHSNAGEREDAACFAVNAGMGVSEVFTISCRHEGCRDKTNLDMLGKMVKDGWFERSALDDANFMAEVDGITTEAVEAAKPEYVKKIEKEDKAKSGYEVEIEGLTPAADDDEIERVLSIVIDANLQPIKWEAALKKLSTALECPVGTVRKYAKVIQIARDREDRSGTGKTKAPGGRLIFPYNGEFNFDEAFDICIKGLKGINSKEQLPVFSCIGSEPVRLMERNEEGRVKVTFQHISSKTLWSELNKLVTFVRRTEQGDGARGPVPKEVADQVYEQAYNDLPQAADISYTPMFLEDGSLVHTPKYHFDPMRPDYLNIYLVPGDLVVPEVPTDPTAEEMQASVDWIKTELLHDFPFYETDSEGNDRREPSEAHAFAMIITPFMRRMIKGRTPVFFVDKPMPGTGGTLLAQLPMWLYDGDPGTVTRYSQNEEEMQKQLIAAVQDRRSHLFFDDVSEFNSRELLRAITQSNISGRLLGASKTISVPNTFNWVGTGNNTAIYDEMRRRVVFIRLNARAPKVNDRVFRHPHVSGMEFIPFIQKHRGLAIHHILTMIQYWISLGMPAFNKRRRASFEDWGSKVGGVLQACGIEGFLDTPQIIETDMNDAANRQFVREFFGKFGVNSMQSPRDLFEWAAGAGYDIIQGNNEDQQRSRFMKQALPALNGRTYTLKGRNYMFRRTLDKDENIGFMLTEVVVEESGEQKAA